MMLSYPLKLLGSLVRERAKTKQRSPKWAAFRDRILAEQPACAACGGKWLRQVHHVQPFHLFPAAELESTNVIVLCMGTRECHVRIGHGDDFKAWNPQVRQHAKIALDGLPKVATNLARSARVVDSRAATGVP